MYKKGRVFICCDHRRRLNSFFLIFIPNEPFTFQFFIIEMFYIYKMYISGVNNLEYHNYYAV